MTDRWLLAEFSGVVTVGVYTLHLKLAAILAQAIVIPFGLWFPPERFKHLKDPDNGQSFFIRVATVLALICIYLSGSLWLARDYFIHLIAPNISASPFILACCLGGVVSLALSQAFNVGLLLPGNTTKNAVSNGYAAFATVVTACIMIPVLGINGAACSRLVGGLVLVIVTAKWSNRAFPISFPFFTLLVYIVASATIAFGIDRGMAGYGLSGLALSLSMWTVVNLVLATLVWSKVGTASRSHGALLAANRTAVRVDDTVIADDH